MYVYNGKDCTKTQTFCKILHFSTKNSCFVFPHSNKNDYLCSHEEAFITYTINQSGTDGMPQQQEQCRRSAGRNVLQQQGCGDDAQQGNGI